MSDGLVGSAFEPFDSMFVRHFVLSRRLRIAELNTGGPPIENSIGGANHGYIMSIPEHDLTQQAVAEGTCTHTGKVKVR